MAHTLFLQTQIGQIISPKNIWVRFLDRILENKNSFFHFIYYLGSYFSYLVLANFDSPFFFFLSISWLLLWNGPNLFQLVDLTCYIHSVTYWYWRWVEGNDFVLFLLKKLSEYRNIFSRSLLYQSLYYRDYTWIIGLLKMEKIDLQFDRHICRENFDLHVSAKLDSDNLKTMFKESTYWQE